MMNEINEKDMEKATGGSDYIDVDAETVHDLTDCCEQYEPNSKNSFAALYKKCAYCTHAEFSTRGIARARVICTLGVKRDKPLNGGVL